MKAKKNKLLTILLEINDASLKYYSGIFFIFLTLNILEKDFVFKHFHFPLIWLLVFVLISAIAKFFFHFNKYETRLKKSDSSSSKLILRIFDFLGKHKGNIKNSIYYIFQFLFVAYLSILLLLQFNDVAFIHRYSLIQRLFAVKINHFLVMVIFFGIFCALVGIGEQKKKKIDYKDYLFCGIVGILGGLLIHNRVKELGWISLIISVVSGLLIIFISIIILSNDEEHNKISARR